ncbi:DUF952 domain-containing protein [Nocardia sp. NPDC051832]|uniref:DUF952 domain-containing protein n=1 Tax=Nocardia sp. NPDC051832 TaxID=3155673 RepID=UPI003427BD54
MIHDTHTLVHICDLADWSNARQIGEYRPASLAEAGFIHLSTPQQAHLPANRLFRGKQDLVLLWIDPDQVGSEVKWEPGVPSDPESMLFPHLYGPLPVAAVTSVQEYRPGADGGFAPLAR